MAANNVGSRMIPTTAKVQNRGWGSMVQPSNKRSVSAAGTRLRRTLSNIFQRDNIEIGFLWDLWTGPGTRGSIHWAICQSPRIQRRRRLTSAL